MGSLISSKGNEAGEGLKLHALCARLAPALQGPRPGLASSSTPWWKPGWGPAASKNHHRLPLIPPILLWLTFIGVGNDVSLSSEGAHHSIHAPSWPSPGRADSSGMSSLGTSHFWWDSQKDAAFQLNSKQLDRKKTFLLVPGVCLTLAVSVLARYYLFNSHSCWVLSNP